MNGSSLGDVPRDHRRMDDQSRHDVEIQVQDRVDGQERLRHDQPADGTIVEGALQPLGRRGLAGGRPATPARTGPASTSARPAWGCACRPSPTSRSARPRTAPRPRARGPAAASRCRTGGALGDPRERGQHLGVNLARVGLPRDRIGLGEAERLGHHPVQSLDLGVVAVEELQEAGLSAGRPLDPQELQARRADARSRAGRGSARSTRASCACPPSPAARAGKWV